MKEKQRKSEERADRLHTWTGRQTDICKKEIEASEAANAVLGTDNFKLNAKPELERLKVWKEPTRKRKITPSGRKLLLDLKALFRLSTLILAYFLLK